MGVELGFGIESWVAGMREATLNPSLSGFNSEPWTSVDTSGKQSHKGVEGRRREDA